MIWDKVFKNGPSKICGRQPLKMYAFKDCPPQILLGPFLNTLFHLKSSKDFTNHITTTRAAVLSGSLLPSIFKHRNTHETFFQQILKGPANM